MIISDLSHFEVVAKLTSIVGGKQPSALLASNMLQGISGQLSSPLRINKWITSGNQTASTTVGSFTTKLPTGVVQGVVSASSATSKKAKK
jgi:hypothetical protein